MRHHDRQLGPFTPCRWCFQRLFSGIFTPITSIPRPQSGIFVRDSVVPPNPVLSFSVYKRKCLHLQGGGRVGASRRKRKRERERGRLASDRNKIARERKETETSAICESGLKPNHCPQSPGTCLTASFGNSSPARLSQTTGLWNRTWKHSSHWGQMHPLCS